MTKQADDDLYTTNVQISELNAINAVFGIMAWKKYYGFYLSAEPNYNTTFIIDEKVIDNAS